MRLLSVPLALSALLLYSCSSEPAIKDAIEVVKAGTLPSHQSQAIGSAFDAAFPEGKWTTYETSALAGMGMTVVQFDATVDSGVLVRAGIRDPAAPSGPVPIQFQFLFSDNKTFGLSYVGVPEQITSEPQIKSILAFVYHRL
ncbi:MAG TPA: hypothetical protein VKU01_08595 [Bryobacteraceae bacterium]|nr:hypothetical protein [Bryobacteraceae bacterium]